jgi:hypothetical protein
MGTNDAWGGSNYNVPVFTKNMQLIIDSCKANNIQPILARVIGTDSAKVGWQVHPDFLKAVDSLTVRNGLVPGPDLYTYFSRHPAELYDGIHPNATGGASVYRLWAEKMDTLYRTPVSFHADRTAPDRTGHRNLSLSRNGGLCIVHAGCPGTLALYSLNGALVKNTLISRGEPYTFKASRGLSIIRFISPSGNEVIAVSVSD